ncbi:hypothetical protein RIF29_26015 [Crotalaria pallida]|uniref:Uncharacterized protein n=1 Tax=Crotalaria pallida TaxID=3830 RepID=A0AAN9EMV9_CROPI
MTSMLPQLRANLAVKSQLCCRRFSVIKYINEHVSHHHRFYAKSQHCCRRFSVKAQPVCDLLVAGLGGARDGWLDRGREVGCRLRVWDDGALAEWNRVGASASGGVLVVECGYIFIRAVCL